jgi:hypothetical protein
MITSAVVIVRHMKGKASAGELSGLESIAFEVARACQT